MKNRPAYILLWLYIITCLLYLTWRAVYTLPLSYGYISIVFGIVLLGAELVGFAETIMFYMTIKNTDGPTTPEVNLDEFPDVDVFVATYNESADLLYKTIVGCKNMDYRNQGKVHIYICDDGNRAEIAKLCETMEIGYITRSENTHAKAGNLNNALTKSNSPYIVTFDADMIPMHDFLMKSIPFFLTGEPIGFVQIPQNFYNPDPFQYNLFSENQIPNEQQLFSRVIQAGKNNYNAIIYAGSNTVISRQALDDVGGFVVGTITEDFATGMLIQNCGYKCIYLNEIHASGLSPESLEDLYTQRIRWGRGVVQTFKAFNPFSFKGLNIKQKLMYFSALSYWYFGIWRFIFLFAPILYTVFGITVLSASLPMMLMIWGPMFVLSQIVFKIFTKNVRNTAWSHIYDTILFPHITKGVMAETLGFKMAKFKVTPKDNVTRTKFYNKFNLVWVQIVIALLSLTGVIRIIIMWTTTEFVESYIINLFWLLYNLYLLSMAILFASERPKFRSAERMIIKTGAIIHQIGRVILGTTYDISETGVTILFEQPIYLDPNKKHKIEIQTERYTANFSAEIVHVNNYIGKYKYAFQIVEIDEPGYQNLLLILYDRVPAMSGIIKKDNLYQNIIKNLLGRRKNISLMNRKLPRIAVNKMFVAYCDNILGFVDIIDFNYMYCSVKSTKKHQNLRIALKNEIVLNLVLDEKLSSHISHGKLIYNIANYQELVTIDGLANLLTENR